jgi:hypothetical protein
MTIINRKLKPIVKQDDDGTKHFYCTKCFQRVRKNDYECAHCKKGIDWDDELPSKN